MQHTTSSSTVATASSNTNTLFVIVGKEDRLLYNFEYSDTKKFNAKDETYMNHFVIHAALDIVDEIVWKNSSLFLKNVEKFGNMSISCYVIPSHVRFVLFHLTTKPEESIRNFFTEVHELYIKVLMNPFYEVNTPITSKVFDERVKQIATKRLFT